MSSASTDNDSLQLNDVEVDVWLEIGRQARCFTYLDKKNLDVGLGDLVLVRLRGQPRHGLVIARRLRSPLENRDSIKQTSSLLEVEAIIQPSAVDAKWREWVEEIAVSCHISSFRMIKAALPSGWLSQKPSRLKEPRAYWWISLLKKFDDSVELTTRQSDLENFLIANGGGAWQKDLQAQGFSEGVLKKLILFGRAIREKRLPEQKNDSYIPSACWDVQLENPRALTHEQKLAISVFEQQASGKAMLLWGVTGSGKTEIYLQLVAKELKAGRNCLLLTPEIGLIPQLVDRCIRRFGERVFEYHSGCTNNERVRTWREVQTSSTPLLVVGTRSAIFLPLHSLGLIVLDEEHDASYKQESPMPCYHARDLALNRAKRIGAKVILGSATPSLSTWKALEPKGDIALARLKGRISKTPLPKVHIVDMRNELAEGYRHLVSRSVMQNLAQLPSLGQQAVVLVPRRGYSSFLSCRSCGDVVQCPNCDVALTVHKGQGSKHWLRCHWCDYRKEAETSCQNCGSTAFKPFGAGTQRVIENLSKELKNLRLLRFDRDSTGGRDGHRKLLSKFASGEADVLIGTQMLAKGMDLPKVTLAVVLAADGLLHRPDLQAEEQSLQLFLQLAGRAGRGDLPGKVFVQTYCPEHPVITHFVNGSYEEFLKSEARIREEAGLVPYSRACLIRLSGESNSVTANAAVALAEQIKPLCASQGWNLVGPAPAMIARVAGKSRWQILLHGPEASPLPLPQVNSLWFGLPSGVNLSVDPDPIQL